MRIYEKTNTTAISSNDVFVVERGSGTSYNTYSMKWSQLVSLMKTGIGTATTSANGLMSSADKTALNGVLNFDTFPTSGSSRAVTSGGIYDVLRDLAISVAPLETDSTAAHSYDIGDVFIWLTSTVTGIFVATTQIASGDTLEIGVNCAYGPTILDLIETKQDTLTVNDDGYITL